MLGIATLSFTGCSDSSDSKENEVIIDFTKGEYKQKILLEDITSASCVACPIATFTTEYLDKSEYADKIISVAPHDDFNPQSVKDPFVLPGIKNLIRAIGLTGYPHISWNRNPDIGGVDFQNFIRIMKNDAGENEYTIDTNLFKNFYTKNKLFSEGSPIGIKIESNLAATNGKVDISLKFSENINQELKYVVYILEDGLVFQQANGTYYYGNTSGKGRWEMDFVHNNVVRAGSEIMGTDITKDKVSNSEFNSENLSFNYTSVDVSKLEVTVLVLNSDGKVINAKTVKGNSSSDYEKM